MPMTLALAEENFHGFLSPHDGVAISFWIISISMVAATVFFLMESMSVGYPWRTSINVGALVTLVAAVHYFYMREFWIQLHSSPILYRYIDWSITVPLQMVEFFFILSAVNPNIGAGMFFRLLLGTVAMLAFGYAGESTALPAWPAFFLGMAGWGFILKEIFVGEAAKEAGNLQAHVKKSYDIMKFIVSAGWSIYPAGYFFGYLILQHRADGILNLIYNLADFVNKIAFCLAIWSCAKADTAENIKKGEAGYKCLA
jgi:bacteriorhodopsin